MTAVCSIERLASGERETQVKDTERAARASAHLRNDWMISSFRCRIRLWCVRFCTKLKHAGLTWMMEINTAHPCEWRCKRAHYAAAVALFTRCRVLCSTMWLLGHCFVAPTHCQACCTSPCARYCHLSGHNTRTSNNISYSASSLLITSRLHPYQYCRIR